MPVAAPPGKKKRKAASDGHLLILNLLLLHYCILTYLLQLLHDNDTSHGRTAIDQPPEELEDRPV